LLSVGDFTRTYMDCQETSGQKHQAWSAVKKTGSPLRQFQI
jgi:hypothetical protein